MLKGLTPRVIELGKIKIGRKSEQVRTGQGGKQWQAPEKLDHFLVTTLQRDKFGNLVPDNALMETLLREQGGGEKLRELPVALLSDEIDEVLVAAHQLYVGKRLTARCDGEQCSWYVDDKRQPIEKPIVVPCNGEHENEEHGWKTHSTLNCVITAGGARWGGVYKFRTTSLISLEQLYSGLIHIQQLTGGVLQGLPMRLVLRAVQVNPVVKGVPTPSTVYVVHIELRGADLTDIQRQAAQLAQLRVTNTKQIHAARREYLRLLAEPESEEEQEAVATEFHAGPANGSPVALLQSPEQAWEASAQVNREADAREEHRAQEPDVAHQDVAAEQAIADAEKAPPAPPKPAERAPAAAGESPLQTVLGIIANAKTSDDLRKVFAVSNTLPAAEKKKFQEAYSAKKTALTAATKNGAAHV